MFIVVVTVDPKLLEENLARGEVSRCYPTTPLELVAEIDRQMNASHFGGLVQFRLVTVA